MANFFPVLLFLSLFVASLVHSRESQFFSKFINNPVGDPTQVVGPSDKQAATLQNQSQDPPSFVAQSHNGYGLYGYGTGQLPPLQPHTASTKTSLPERRYYNKQVYAAPDGEVASDTKALLHRRSFDTAAVTENGYDRSRYFPTEKPGFHGADARLQGSSYSTNAATRATYGNVVANGRNNYYAAEDARQQQGLSDTRFLENGKYYYNIDDGEKYEPARNAGLGAGASTYEKEFYASGGYEPLKKLEAFRATRNVDGGGFSP